MKPYALPVQLVSYTGLNQSKVRSIINGVIAEMTKREMKVAGEICACTMYMYMYMHTLSILIHCRFVHHLHLKKTESIYIQWNL